MAASGGLLGYVLLAGGLPVPGQQRVELLRGMIGDPGQHVGEPGLGVSAAISIAFSAAMSSGRSAGSRAIAETIAASWRASIGRVTIILRRVVGATP